MSIVIHLQEDSVQNFTGLRAEMTVALLENPSRDWTALEISGHLRERSVLTAHPSVVCPRFAELVKLGIAEELPKRPCAIGRRRKKAWRLAEGAAERIKVEGTRW